MLASGPTLWYAHRLRECARRTAVSTTMRTADCVGQDSGYDSIANVRRQRGRLIGYERRPRRLRQCLRRTAASTDTGMPTAGIRTAVIASGVRTEMSTA